MLGTLGGPELVIIVIVCLLLFGTKRLPELGKGVGEGIRNFKRALREGTEDGSKED